MSLRHQLTAAFLLLAFVIQLSIALFVILNMRSLLTTRSFDLLLARNTATMRHYSMKIAELQEAAADCGHDSSSFLAELKRSPHFRRAEVLSGPPPPEPLRLDQQTSELSIILNCTPTKGTATKVVLHTRWLSNLFTDRAGLGESGETYFMTEQGTLLTDSRFTENPGPAPIPAEFEAHWRGRKRDYRGVPVFGVWDAVYLGGTKGIIASEKDVAEVLNPAEDLLTYLLLFLSLVSLVCVPFARFLARNLSWRAEEFAAIQQARNLALIEGQEQERVRIGLELHDDIGQELAALSWRISGTEEPLAQDDVRLVSVRRMAAKIRALSSGLLTSVVSADGLESSLRQLIHENQERARSKGMTLELKIDAAPGTLTGLTSDFKVGIYRITQEAINNMLKHSGATRGRITVSANENGEFHLILEDNGQGLKPQPDAAPRKRPALGMHTIHIRTEALKGKLKIDPATASGGLRIDAHFNLRESMP